MNFTVLEGGFSISGGKLVSNNGSNSLASFSGSFSNDQAACLTMTATDAAFQALAPAVRINGTNAYILTLAQGTAQIYLVRNGAGTGSIGPSYTWSPGDSLCLTVQATTLKV